MSNLLTSHDFLEIMLEYLECHGQITVDHDQVLLDEAQRCLRSEALSPSSNMMGEVADVAEDEAEAIKTGVSFAKETYDTLTPSEQKDFIDKILSEKSQGIAQIPVSMVKQCYLKEMGENCDEDTALKIASQVARDLDYHKSIHQQVRDACQSAEDENMLSLLSL